MKKRLLIVGAILSFLLSSQPLPAEEGMYPISEIYKLDLQHKGLILPIDQLYNPNGVSLIDGICQVGGATGSFVSQDGLILTNHHVAYRAVNAASTEEHDYLQNGFVAWDRSQETEAKGYTVRITESYRDVSDKVLSVVTEGMDLAERTRAIDKKIKEIVTEAEKEHPGKRAGVSEMFMGKTYVLFIYTYLRDIRLVYVPPLSIGNFGGEKDNWMWPRHTGDFSFLRAYVAPDGSPAAYSPDNVPYHPKRVLRVDPAGVKEGDFVFILGYPGRTYRHRTSFFFVFEEEVRMPFVVDYYQWMINVMEGLSRKDRSVALKLSSRIKGLSNTMKNYRGKLIGMQRLSLTEKKQKEEQELQAFIERDVKRKAVYGSILQEIGEMYSQTRKNARQDLVFRYLLSSCTPLSNAYTVYQASLERAKSDLERESAFMNRNWQNTKNRMLLFLESFYQPGDSIMFKDIVNKAAQLPQEQRIKPLRSLGSGGKLDEFLHESYRKTIFIDRATLAEALEHPAETVKRSDDPFLALAKELYPLYQKRRDNQERIQGQLDKLQAKLLDVKRQFSGKDFIPDANGTLRLTYGHIRQYSPRDAVIYRPITTVQGVLEKYTGKAPYDAPQKLLDLIKNKDFGRFAHPKLGMVPTGILYDMDTTGGNSGSPVLNARGELVGLNFDRTFEATINDFAWSAAYSRSIGVDIRYILWLVQKYGGADYLLKEMGVDL